MAVITVCSAKGGVGKTTITANLGYALTKQFCQKTLLVDANLTTASLSLHFGLTSFPVKFLDMLAKDMIGQITYPFDAGLDILPAPLRFTGIKQRKMAWLKRLEYDFVLVDAGPGIESEARMAIRPADRLLVITTPDLPSVTGVIKTVALAEKLGKEILGVVINRVQHRRTELTKGEIEAILGCNIICELPEEPGMAECVILQKPILCRRPYCAFSRAIKRLAAHITGLDYRPGLLEQLAALFG